MAYMWINRVIVLYIHGDCKTYTAQKMKFSIKDFFSKKSIFLMISANVWHISTEPLPDCFDVKIRFQSSASNPQGPTLCLQILLDGFALVYWLEGFLDMLLSPSNFLAAVDLMFVSL